MYSRLCVGLEHLNIPWEEQQVRGILHFTEEIMHWNPTHGLIGREGGAFDSPDGVIVRHILDSLAPLSVIAAGSPGSIIDVGSGAGLPGVPLALFMPDTTVTLLERKGKRCGFLRSVVVLLGIMERVEVVEMELEELYLTADVVVLRAVAQPSSIYSQLRRITARGGRIVSYQGKHQKAREEIDKLHRLDFPPKKAEFTPIEVPFLDAQRCVVEITP